MAIRGFLAAILASAAFAGSADAALVIELTPATLAQQGSTGNQLLVSVRGLGNVAPPLFDQVNAFSIILNITPAIVNPGATGVTFTGGLGGVTEPAGYIFAGDPGENGPVTLSAAGTTLNFTGDTTLFEDIDLGELFPLGTILFDVDALATVGSIFNVSVDVPGSSFFDPASSPVPISDGPLDVGTITVTAAPAAVPEPSSMTLLGLCGLAGGGLAWRRRRAAKGEPAPAA